MGRLLDRTTGHVGGAARYTSWLDARTVFRVQDEDRFCVATAEQNIAFVLQPHRAMYYKADIAALLQLNVLQLHLQPAQPRIHNTSLYGRACRTVVAANDSPASAQTLHDCLLDCRPLLRGWRRLTAVEGWVELVPVLDNLQRGPRGWDVRIVDCPGHWERVWTQPGQVLLAHLEPQRSAEVVPAPISSAQVEDDMEGPTADRATAAPEPSAQSTAEQHVRTVSSGVHRPRSGRWGLALLVVAVMCWSCDQRLAAISPMCFVGMSTHSFVGTLCLSLTLGLNMRPVTAMQVPVQQHTALEQAGLASVWKSFETSCQPPQLRLEQQCAFGQRLVPTPCRGNTRLPSTEPDIADVAPLITLLEESAAATDDWAFFAATLLETLFETLSETYAGSLSTPHATCSQALVLADAVPITAYQQQCMSLQALLPPVGACSIEADWLDNDLSGLLQYRGISLCLRTQFLNLQKWHDSSDWASVEAIDIYTDGSASGTSEPLLSAPMGWAFTVWCRTAQQNLFYGAASGVAVAPDAPYYLGETEDSSLQSELLALNWALAWIVEHGYKLCLPICVKYDCQAAGQGTFCEAKQAHVMPCTGQLSLSRLACVLRQCAQGRASLRAVYVPGHAGILGNELSDGFAKLARACPVPFSEWLLPTWPSQLARHPLVEWAWLAASPVSDMPRLFAFQAAAACLQTAPPAERPPPVMGLEQFSPPEESVPFDITFMSYNALTLLDPKPGTTVAQPVGLKIAGKRHMLIEQCHAAKVHFVGLQETRLQDTAVLPDRSYILLHSAATETGNLGCALWVSKLLPYAYADRQPLYFNNQQCTVAALSARHLLVTFHAPHFEGAVLVAHAPSDPQGKSGLAHSFWKQCSADVRRLPARLPLIVLTDANSRVGSHPSPAMGDFGAEDETVAGALFHDFLLAHNLCLPSTFGELHAEESWTWRSAIGDCHRIDYIAVPQAWMQFHLHSRVWYDFEAMQKKCDHVPVVLRCRFQKCVTTAADTIFRRKACRPDDRDSGLDRQVFFRTLSSHPLPAWELDVDTHFTRFTDAWTQAGQAVIAVTRPSPRQAFLTAETMDLVHARKELRKYLRQEEAELCRRYQMIGFAAFVLHRQQTAFSLYARGRVEMWLHSMDVSIAQAWASLNFACRLLRQAVKTDRNNYLAQVVEDVTLADISRPKQLFQKVRRAFPKAAAARRSRFTALPAVELLDGTLAQTTEARAERWRAHFAEQESGTPTTDEAFVVAVQAKDQARAAGRKVVFDPAMLLTLTSLEADILNLRRAKAAGPDGLTAELFRLSASQAARQLLALNVKSILAIREPIEFKGGAL